MYISRISIKKSRTSGVSVSSKTKFNKIEILVDAEPDKEEGYIKPLVASPEGCFDALSEFIDAMLEKTMTTPPSSIINE